MVKELPHLSHINRIWHLIHELVDAKPIEGLSWVGIRLGR